MMRSHKEERDTTIAFDNRDTRETPKAITGVTWAMVAVLALIAILGALFLSGFFSAGKNGYDERTYPGATRSGP